MVAEELNEGYGNWIAVLSSRLCEQIRRANRLNLLYDNIRMDAVLQLLGRSNDLAIQVVSDQMMASFEISMDILRTLQSMKRSGLTLKKLRNPPSKPVRQLLKKAVEYCEEPDGKVFAQMCQIVQGIDDIHNASEAEQE